MFLYLVLKKIDARIIARRRWVAANITMLLGAQGKTRTTCLEAIHFIVTLAVIGTLVS